MTKIQNLVTGPTKTNYRPHYAVLFLTIENPKALMHQSFELEKYLGKYGPIDFPEQTEIGITYMKGEGTDELEPMVIPTLERTPHQILTVLADELAKPERLQEIKELAHKYEYLIDGSRL